MGRRIGFGMGVALATLLATLLAGSSAEALEPPAPAVDVHLKSPRPVTVFFAASGTQSWNRLCDAPCTTQIQLPVDLRVDSKVITLDKPGAVDIDIDPPNKTWMTTGLIVGGVGALTTLVGGAYFLLSLVAGSVGGGDCSKYPVNPTFGTSRADCEDDNDKTDTMRTIGLVLMGAGVVPMAVGAALYIPASRTSVRMPAWREVGAANRAANWAAAPPAQFPLRWSVEF
jgi:hypothetical protein